MEQVTLGRTGLTVSVAGLGCGGRSRLGRGRTHTQGTIADSVNLVRAALDLGINYIDTAQGYGTEAIVGAGIRHRRESVVLATKIHPVRRGPRGRKYIDAPTLRQQLRTSLRNLGSDVIDVLFLHGVSSEDYAYCAEELVPELDRLRDWGEIRFSAISERFSEDLDHSMLRRALQDGVWDVILVGFNMLNPSAKDVILPVAAEKNIGITVMYAVRDLLSRPDELRRAIVLAARSGLIDSSGIDLGDPLGFLLYDGGARSIVEAAYRFARHESNCHVVLTGTGSLDHLTENVKSISLGPLQPAECERIAAIFCGLRSFSGDSISEKFGLQ
jgi:aryl-alcohol dehydrogenase-like predicted oxidoreductase